MTAVRMQVGLVFLSMLAVSCGSSDGCPDLSGSYSVTTEIVDTDCRFALHAISQPVTWTFEQTAPSCSFTMSNSLYPDAGYSGSFTMHGSKASVTWTSVEPAPTAAGHALTYTSEDLTVTGASKISGSFAWTSAAPCSGTTNVCSGTIEAGCLKPN